MRLARVLRRPVGWLGRRFARIFPDTRKLWAVGLVALVAGLVGMVHDPWFGGHGRTTSQLLYVDPSGWFDVLLVAVGLLLMGSWRFPIGSRRTSAVLVLLLTVLAAWGCVDRGNVLGLAGMAWGNVTLLGGLAVAISRNGLRGFMDDEELSAGRPVSKPGQG